MKKLSVIIPFLNQGAEIEQTVIEIKRTAGECVDIILVNDASIDEFDYISIAKMEYLTLPVQKVGSFAVKNFTH